MTPATDRTHYRAMVAEVAAKAKAILPQAVNGRVGAAVKLVLAHDVTPQADGSIEVGSSSDPLKTYRLVGTTCDCQDFQHGQAPAGWCQHRIAAGIAKRVHELLPEPAPVPVALLPAPPAVPATPLPEAPVSITLKAHLHGQEVLVTLRGTDFASVKAQVEEASAWLQAQTPAPATDTTPECPQHGAMKPSTKGKGFYCAHKLEDGSWCGSKVKGAKP